jgi:hypothetical protein
MTAGGGPDQAKDGFRTVVVGIRGRAASGRQRFTNFSRACGRDQFPLCRIRTDRTMTRFGLCNARAGFYE